MGRKNGPLAFLIGAVLLWLSSRSPWVVVSVEDDKTGNFTVDINGSVWATELIAVALLLVVGAIAGVALRRAARRGVGILSAVISAALLWRPLQFFISGPQPQRAYDLLVIQQTSSTQVDHPTVSSWASIVSTQIAALGPLLSLAGAAVAFLGAMMLIVYPGQDGVKVDKYHLRAVRAQQLSQDLSSSPDSGQVLWDALDEDIDPTDLGDFHQTGSTG